MSKITKASIDQFVKTGFLKLEQVFSQELAENALEILWKATGKNSNDTSTWTEPVIYLGDFAQRVFREAANSPLLHQTFDALVGVDNWIPRMSLGSFPVRFPSSKTTADTGWHVDASFPGDDPADYMKWRINICSKNRGLLMLFLFTDVSEKDAPTRLKVGSHMEIARILHPYGQKGLDFMELAEKIDTSSMICTEALATGKAGTVYLCHPFLVHSAQAHRGKTPKFMAQPPLFTKNDLSPLMEKESYPPVEIAIRKALKLM